MFDSKVKIWIRYNQHLRDFILFHCERAFDAVSSLLATWSFVEQHKRDVFLYWNKKIKPEKIVFFSLSDMHYLTRICWFWFEFVCVCLWDPRQDMDPPFVPLSVDGRTWYISTKRIGDTEVWGHTPWWRWFLCSSAERRSYPQFNKYIQINTHAMLLK